MKKLKTLFLAIFILTSLSTSAQLSFGLKGGLNISNLKLSHEMLDEDEKRAVKPGFNAGITAEYMFTENMGIQSGLSFSTLGTKSKVSFEQDNINIKAKRIKSADLNTLQVPVHFAYRHKFAENYNLTVHAGPYLGYILSGKQVEKYEGTFSGKTNKATVSHDFYGKEPLLNRLDAGLGFGVAFGYGNCYVDLGYDIGLVNLIKFDKNQKEEMQKEKVEIPSIKTTNIYLSVGYKF